MHVSFHRASSSRILSGGPTRATSSTIASGMAAAASCLLARQVELLDLRGDVLVAHAGEDLEVEVGPPGSHAAGVEGEERAHEVGAAISASSPGMMNTDGDDLEAVGLAVLAAGREALGQAATVEPVLLRGEEQRQPAVGDLAGQGDVLRAFGGEEDRQVGPHVGGRST